MNIIHICIDSLCYKDLFNNKYNVAPNLLKYASQSVIIPKYLANAGPTQFALPSVFTSSYPLDYGGYDDGIIYRPSTLPKILKQYGYQNYFVGTNAWINHKEGYLHWFDNYIDANDPKLFWDNSKIYFNYNLEKFENGYISLIELLQITFNRARNDLERTIISIDNINSTAHGYKDSHIIRNYSKEKIVKYFNKFFDKYLDDNFQPSIEDIEHLVDFDYILNHKRNIITKIINKISRKFHCYYHKGDFLVKNTIDILKNANNNNFYIYLQLYDIHERNYNNTNFQKFGINLNKRLKKIGSDKRYNILQILRNRVDDKSRIAASLSYVDEQFGILYSYLVRTGLINNTLIIINSDHGLGGYSQTRNEQLTGSLYNEYLHVPCIIGTPNKIVINNIANINTHIDIAPTILDYLNLPKMKDAKGKSILSSENHSKIHLFENATLGPCDLKNGKQIQIGIIKDSFKVISLIDFKNEKFIWIKLFNIRDDWNEINNLSEYVKYQELISGLIKIILNRVKEIKNQIMDVKSREFLEALPRGIPESMETRGFQDALKKRKLGS